MTERTFINLGEDRRGATIIEFAIVLPALALILMATMELGYRMYVASIVQGALHEGARMATVGNRSIAQIDQHMKHRLQEFDHQATILTNVASYSDFSDVNVPETVTSDSEPSGRYNEGDCFEDYNGNGQYDLDRGRAGSLGQADDIVRYEVSISYPRLFPLHSLVGWARTDTVRANTVLRNQPFAGRTISTPPEICT